MSTRATSLASRRAKQKLIRLLFDESSSSTGKSTAATTSMDPHSCSYSQLKSAYLERLQQIHPDKHLVQKKRKHDWHDLFVELQSAWDQYESVARIMDKTCQNQQSNFTMFGVGCSFSDSPTERELRSAITDQACRGWFSSGALDQVTTTTSQKEEGHDDNENSNNSSVPQKQTPLCDDDMFVQENEHNDAKENETRRRQKTARRRRFLVDQGIENNYSER